MYTLDDDEIEEENPASNQKWAAYSKIIEYLGKLHGMSCSEYDKDYRAYA